LLDHQQHGAIASSWLAGWLFRFAEPHNVNAHDCATTTAGDCLPGYNQHKPKLNSGPGYNQHKLKLNRLYSYSYSNACEWHWWGDLGHVASTGHFLFRLGVSWQTSQNSVPAWVLVWLGHGLSVSIMGAAARLGDHQQFVTT
jgi:hypothetical protein